MDNLDFTIRIFRSVANLDQIQTFVEVARASSFAQAARRLSLPRSTVTARVRALEERLNVRLLHRTTRKVTLTDEGQRYFDRCAAAMGELLQAEDDLTGASEPAGTIRISVPIDFPKTTLAEMLSTFVERYPGVAFYVDVSDTPVDLVANNIDIALRGRQVGMPGLIARRLGEHATAFFATPDTVREYPDTATLLAALPILDPGRVLDGPRKPRGPAPVITTGNFELAKALAITMGVLAVLPEELCAQEVASGRLVAVDCGTSPPALPHFAVMPTRSLVPRRVRLFADFLAAQLAGPRTP